MIKRENNILEDPSRSCRRHRFSFSWRLPALIIVAVVVIAIIIILSIQSATFPTIDQFASKLELKGFTSSYTTAYEANESIVYARYCQDESESDYCFNYIEYLKDGTNAAHYAYLSSVDTNDDNYSDVIENTSAKDNASALFQAKNASGDEIYIIHHDSVLITVTATADYAADMSEIVDSLHLIQ